MKNQSRSINGLGITANARRWTEQANECYYRGCICEGCFFENYFSDGDRCKMKITVLELVRLLSRPEGDEECQKQMIIQ